MRMQIFGLNPTGPKGEYFGISVFWWIPLVAYCVDVAPTICAPCKHWESNDGDGLDAGGALALATALQYEVDKGLTQIVAEAFESVVEQTIEEPFNTYLSFSVENVVRFIAFLRESGGFKIC